jgi:hypothetical protein
MGVRQGDALQELPKIAHKSYDMVCSGLWPNPGVAALQIIAQESIRIARKAVFLQTVHEYDAYDLIAKFRQLGYAPRMLPGIKIQNSQNGGGIQWQLLVPIPKTIRSILELPFDRPYGPHEDKIGALTGNELVTPRLRSMHRDNPDGTRQSSSWNWIPVTVKRHSELQNQPSQAESIPLRIYQEWLKPNDSVLDFSCGSGTNGVAAKKLFLKFDGMDISPQHVLIAQDRIATTKVSSLQDGKKQAMKEIMEPYERIAKWAPKAAKAGKAGQ